MILGKLLRCPMNDKGPNRRSLRTTVVPWPFLLFLVFLFIILFIDNIAAHFFFVFPNSSLRTTVVPWPFFLFSFLIILFSGDIVAHFLFFSSSSSLVLDMLNGDITTWFSVLISILLPPLHTTPSMMKMKKNCNFLKKKI